MSHTLLEEDLIRQLLAHINAGNVRIHKAKIAKKLKADIERLQYKNHPCYEMASFFTVQL